MRIIKTNGFWTVNGVASFEAVETAVDIALDTLADVIKGAPVHTLWTQFGSARR
jgi:hypothetical protein